MNKEEKHLHEPYFFFNLCSHRCEGRAFGKVTDILKGAGNRIRLKYDPTDIGLYEKKKGLVPKTQTLILGRGKKVDFPKGTLSKNLNICVGLPNRANDFPDEIKETPFGKFLMFYTEIQNSTNVEIDALTEGLKRQSSHLRNMGYGEVSESRMDMIEGLMKDALDMVKEGKKDKNVTQLQPGMMPGGV